MLHRFKQELVLSRQITHKNVIRIYDLGTAPGLVYISMEYIEGQDLATLLESRRLSLGETESLIRQICLGLDAAHSEGIIHRDLKPQNILVSRSGKASVMDFGLARLLEQPGVTRVGMLIGTPYYMSPEQAEGRPVDTRSDLFAAGIIFYEMLTGVIPFQADTILASLLKRTREAPPEPRSVNGDVPEALSRIVTKCLQARPEDRYQTAAEIVADLQRVQDAPSDRAAVATLPAISSSSAIENLESAGRASQGRRLPSARVLTAAGIALVLVAAGAGLFAWNWSGAPVRPARATGKAVKVVVADFVNQTGEPVFDGTLEPMFNFAIEGAGFVTSYNRAQARKLAGQLGYAVDKLDERSARLIAVREGLDVVVTGSLARNGSAYRVSAKAVDPSTGKTITTAQASASGREAVLAVMPDLAAPIRKALGDSDSGHELRGETFTAGSLEAAQSYATGQDLLLNGDFEKSREAFTTAMTMDPKFGRAYASMAVASLNLGLREDGEKYFKLALSHLDRMTERERYRTRGAYYIMRGDQQKCIDEYKALVTRFPSDTAGHNNLALCYTQLRMMQPAIEEMRRAVEISPKHAMFRNNLALFSAYAGEFAAAEQQAKTAQQLNPSYAKAFLALAFAQLGKGQTTDAASTYHRLSQVGPRQASLATTALADLAIYEGRYTEAIQMLDKAAQTDAAAGDGHGAAIKFAMLAHAQLSRGQSKAAVAAASAALTQSSAADVRLLAGRVLSAGTEIAKTQGIIDALNAEVGPEPQAYAKILAGRIALAQGKTRVAVKEITDANRILDTWIGRYDAGSAYLAAGAFAEADSEFDQCIRRKGEALSLFVDEVPTFGYFPAVYYSLGRVREALQSSRFADPYRDYLAIRGNAGQDPLVGDIHRRIKQK
jgi:tetratricopeptide (TPR) repeat protein